MITDIYVVGSRVGGWHHENSDLDIVMIDHIKSWNGMSGGFRFNDNIRCEISFKKIQDIRYKGYHLGAYDLMTGWVFNINEDDIRKYLELKKREINEETEKFIRFGEPCSWLIKNTDQIKEKMIKFIEIYNVATPLDLTKLRKEYI